MISSDPQTTLHSPAQLARLQAREGSWKGISHGIAPGYVQCNLVVVPRDCAFELLLYCQRNQKACPVLEVTDPGDPEPKRIAPGADLRTDLPRYAVYRNGIRQDDVFDIRELWTHESVGFLIGSGITFDEALERAGISTRENRWVLRTSIPTIPAGCFRGPLIVTMRWIRPDQVAKAIQVTSRFPLNHGGPIHVGSPQVIGADLKNPIHGPPVDHVPGEWVPLFWACGVTPQAAAEEARLDCLISHAPAHGFISDLKADEICLG